MNPEPAISEVLELRDRVGVFRDRVHAGEVLAGMLEGFRGSDALVLAVPAGGVPVAREVAARLGLALDVAVVSKVTWYDVSEEEAQRILDAYRKDHA